jgi:prolipoprotein diacylglyceryltransferase
VRHPSQLYEAALGLFLLVLLLVADRLAGKEKRPEGLLFGLFLTVYFALRFLVEFTKEYQTLDPRTSPLNMGQLLSILPFVLGALVLFFVYRRERKSKKREPLTGA